MFQFNVNYDSNESSRIRSWFKIFSINIHSIRNKIYDLQILAQNLKWPQVICIGEPWVEPGTEFSYQFNGYTTHCIARSDGYGGLMVAVRNDVRYSMSKSYTPTNEEFHILVIRLHDLSLDLVNCYRRPNDSNINDFADTLDSILELTNDVILIGDINADLRRPKPNHQPYFNTLEANSLGLLNRTSETDFTYAISNGPGAPGSILDHIASNTYSLNYNIDLIDNSLSDHRALILAIEHQKQPELIQHKSRLDNQLAINDFLIDWGRQVDHSIDNFHTILANAVAINTITAEHKKRCNRVSWMTDELLAEMRYRDILNKLRKLPNLSAVEKITRDTIYRSQRNKVNSLRKAAQQKQVTQMITEAKGDQKKSWQIVRYVLTNNSDSNPSKLPTKLQADDGTTLTDPQLIADELSKHFANVSVGLKNELINYYCNRPRSLTEETNCSRSIILNRITPEELMLVVKSLKRRSASGTDGISVSLLLSVISAITPTASEAFNNSMMTGTFPISLKTTRVTALHKGGDASICGNYRPISVVSTVSKLYEKLLYNRIEQFITNEELMHPQQYGFQEKCSTSSATLGLVNELVKSIEAKKFTAAIFLDISKAFDCVPHDLLLQKLDKIGIRDTTLKIIENYLFGRTTSVHMENIKGTRSFTIDGVPQGSVLSPLLFRIFMNDIFQLDLCGHLQLFADDGVLSYSAESTDQLFIQMQHDLRLIERWCYNNLLSINPSKTKYMIICQKGLKIPSFPIVMLKNQPIERVFAYKYLGLHIDAQLNWQRHIDLVKGKIRPFLAVLRRIKWLVPESTKLSLYYAYIHSHLSYLTSLWGQASKNLIQQLIVMQNKAIRYIFWKEYYIMKLTTDRIRQKYNILDVPQLVKYDRILTIFKIDKGLMRTSVTFPRNIDLGVRTARRQSRFYVPTSRTNYMRNSIFFTGITDFNNLPDTIRHERILFRFKRHLKTHLITQSQQSH